MAYAAEKLGGLENTGEAKSRFARRNTVAISDGNVFYQPDRADGAAGSDDARGLGLSIFQFVGSSLEGGPRGIYSPTHIAALAAIAGYAAKFAVLRKVSRGQLSDDFQRVTISRTKSVIASEQVNQLVLSMEKPSVAGIVIETALRCGLQQIPDTNALLQSHLADPDGNFSVPAAHAPDVPTETLLMMYWEAVARFFRSSPASFDMAPLAAAHAVGEAIAVYRNSVPVDMAVRISLDSAIAMSKVDRVF